MKSEELRKRYSQGKRDFPWADLVGSSLDDINAPDLRVMRGKLAGSSWKRACLDRLQGLKIDAPDGCFADASLIGSNLTRAVLTRADLRNACLMEAYLFGANLHEAHLEGADLRGAVLDRADLRGTDFTNAQLDKASLDSVLFDDATIAPDDSDWPTWYAANPPEPDPADEPEEDRPGSNLTPEELLAARTDPRRTWTRRILSFKDYRQDIVKFQPRGIRRQSLLDNVALPLVGFQVVGYGIAGGVFGLFNVPLTSVAALTLLTIGWHWDRSATLVAPSVTIAAMFAAILIPPTAVSMALTILSIMTIVVMVPFGFKFFSFKYQLLTEFLHALWVASWALIALLFFNGAMGIMVGRVSFWVGTAAVASGVLAIAGSPLWIDLAQRGYSARQAMEICVLFGGGSLSLGWLLGRMI